MASRKLPDPNAGELRVLSTLWSRGPSSRETLAKYHDLPDFDRDFESALQNGLIVPHGRKGATFEAAVSEETSYKSTVRKIAERAFDGSMKRLVQSLLGDRPLSAKEREEIKRYMGNID
ncbi:MAG: putative transcriptional regulator [Phycisphaerales bacterium]|nr:putative transcriptional regulator [Phycisphaerales bacterium]